MSGRRLTPGLMALALLVAPQALARDGGTKTDTVWVQAEASYGFVGSIGVGGVNAQPDIGVFAVGVHYRFYRVDLGVRFAHFGSSTTSIGRGATKMGGQFSVNGWFRWHYAEQSWGAFYLSANFGFMAFDHHDEARAAMADPFNDLPPLDPDDLGVDEYTGGFVFGLGTGLIFYISPQVAAFIGIDSSFGFTTVHDGFFDQDYTLSVLAIVGGIELGL